MSVVIMRVVDDRPEFLGPQVPGRKTPKRNWQHEYPAAARFTFDEARSLVDRLGSGLVVERYGFDDERVVYGIDDRGGV